MYRIVDQHCMKSVVTFCKFEYTGFLIWNVPARCSIRNLSCDCTSHIRCRQLRSLISICLSLSPKYYYPIISFLDPSHTSLPEYRGNGIKTKSEVWRDWDPPCNKKKHFVMTQVQPSPVGYATCGPIPKGVHLTSVSIWLTEAFRPEHNYCIKLLFLRLIHNTSRRCQKCKNFRKSCFKFWESTNQNEVFDHRRQRRRLV